MSIYKRGAAVIGALTILTTAVFFGGLTVGQNGTAIEGIYSGTSSTNFGVLPALAATSSYITVPNAPVGALVSVGITSGEVLSTSSIRITDAYVATTGTVTFGLFNASSTGEFNLSAATFRAIVTDF